MSSDKTKPTDKKLLEREPSTSSIEEVGSESQMIEMKNINSQQNISSISATSPWNYTTDSAVNGKVAKQSKLGSNHAIGTETAQSSPGYVSNLGAAPGIPKIILARPCRSRSGQYNSTNDGDDTRDLERGSRKRLSSAELDPLGILPPDILRDHSGRVMQVEPEHKQQHPANHSPVVMKAKKIFQSV